MLETLNKEFIKRVLQKILNRLREKFSEIDRKQLINDFDQDGNTILHYVTALNYYELIPLLYENGADLNVKSSKNNLTPLMVAAAKGYEKSVKKLMRLGAVFWNENNLQSIDGIPRSQKKSSSLNTSSDFDQFSDKDDESFDYNSFEFIQREIS